MIQYFSYFHTIINLGSAAVSDLLDWDLIEKINNAIEVLFL